MSRKANPTLIGLFIVVGLCLGAGAILLVTSSRLFNPTKEYILYFNASLKGLDPGAAVKFRGVTIGSVKEVLIHMNQAPADSSLPVIIQLNENLLKKRSDPAFDLTSEAEMDAHVKRGLRGRLEAESLLTGLLYVDLEFVPGNTPATYHQLKPVHKEIPTAPTEIQTLLENLARVDVAGLTQKMETLLTRLDDTLHDLDAREINRGITNLLVSLQGVISSGDLTNTLVSARRTLDELGQLSGKMRSRVDGLADSADQTLVESRATLSDLRQGLQEMRDLLDPHASLRKDINVTLDQMTETARSLGELSDLLTRHPNALLSGRKTPAPKP